VATCPSGQGAVCKTAYTGSNPVVASTDLSMMEPGGRVHYDLTGDATFVGRHPATLDLGPMAGTYTATAGGVTRTGPTTDIRDFFTGVPSSGDLGAWPLEEGDFC
jgi:hypothetical protein